MAVLENVFIINEKPRTLCTLSQVYQKTPTNTPEFVVWGSCTQHCRYRGQADSKTFFDLELTVNLEAQG